MKFATFNGGHLGMIEGAEIVDVTDLAGVTPGSWPPVGMVKFIADFQEIEPALRATLDGRPRQNLSSVRLECPIQWPNKVIAYPANYDDHIDEMRGVGLISTFKADGQGFFVKANSSLSGPIIPSHSQMSPAARNSS